MTCEKKSCIGTEMVGRPCLKMDCEYCRWWLQEGKRHKTLEAGAVPGKVSHTRASETKSSPEASSSSIAIDRISRTKVLYVSLAAITSAFVVEMALGLISNSLALITDSIHALLDCVVTAILLLAVRMAIKPPDAKHTYGHGKMESLGGMMGGIAILAIACFFIYESIHRIQAPPPSVIPGLLAIAGGTYTIGIDIFRIILLRKNLAGSNSNSTTIKADLYHAMLDLGSTVVAIGGIVLAYLGAYQGDHVAALILGGLLVALSIKLVYKTALDLTDAIPPDMVSHVRRITNATKGVTNTKSILMRRSGDTVFADITIRLRGDTSFDHAHKISANVEDNIMQKIPGASVTVHFEPDWHDVLVDARILDIAKKVDGVRDVYNVNTYKTTDDITHADLHVMVDSTASLTAAHKISEIIDSKIKHEIPKIKHTAIHLEPFTLMPRNFNSEDTLLNEKIKEIIKYYPQVNTVGKISSLNFENVFKIDIDCSFDETLSIKEVRKIISDIEHTVASKIGNAVITIHPESA